MQGNVGPGNFERGFSPQPQPLGSPGAQAQVAPTHKLYTKDAVGIATFLGSPLAGSIVMAINYLRLNRNGAALASIPIGLGVTVIEQLLWVGVSRAHGSSSISLIFLAIPFFARWLAGRLQGTDFAAHVNTGGKTASPWKAAGIGLLVGFFTCWLSLAYVFGGSVFDELRPTSVTFGSGEEVRYRGDASEEDARRLGQFLVDIEYFDGQGAKTVELIQDDEGYLVKLILNEQARQRPRIRPQLQFISELMSALVFSGESIRVWLCDANLRPWERLVTTGRTTPLRSPSTGRAIGRTTDRKPTRQRIRRCVARAASGEVGRNSGEKKVKKERLRGGSRS